MSDSDDTSQPSCLIPAGPDPLIGVQIDGRYTVKQRIGSGGFARVYRATQERINREVAIKVLHSLADDSSDTIYEQRFLREAQIAASLQHPNVVVIHEYGIFEGQPFIVMELLQGHDLKHELRHHGALTPERTLRLIRGCLAALGKGHQMGIVHKDLKPANLFLHEPGTPNELLRILDFGIARLEGGQVLTQSLQVLGTPQYLAPEYIRDQIVSPAFDVYQMGLLLTEMLIGRPVVRSSSDPMLALFKHANGELEIPLALLECPLGPILRRALAFDHHRRYEDCAAFAAALEGINPADIPTLLSDAPVVTLTAAVTAQRLAPPAPEAALPGSPQASGASLRSRALLGLAAVALLGIGGALVWLLGPGAQRADDPAGGQVQAAGAPSAPLEPSASAPLLAGDSPEEAPAAPEVPPVSAEQAPPVSAAAPASADGAAPEEAVAPEASTPALLPRPQTSKDRPGSSTPRPPQPRANDEDLLLPTRRQRKL